MKNSKVKIALILCSMLALTLTGCAAGKYKPVPNPSQLEVSLADPLWDGKNVPKGQQCNRFSGQGQTPVLQVKNIPAEANAVILEFSDRDASHMDNGGHGMIGYKIKNNAGEVSVPSVKGHTFDLPQGFFLVSAHNNPSWDTAGAYMPPCSGGRGNRYYVTVKAVYDAPEGQESKMLAKGQTNLGSY